ncbi:NUDIX domain-containing protein [Streptomyces sp. MS19]|uniref:NUDIX domain-containing protein n=1 Tax=Streptomyces sp. MS19 TaxID=3385972 RepID=UPI0039A22530
MRRVFEVRIAAVNRRAEVLYVPAAEEGWMLPGGICEPGEPVEEAASAWLASQAGIRHTSYKCLAVNQSIRPGTEEVCTLYLGGLLISDMDRIPAHAEIRWIPVEKARGSSEELATVLTVKESGRALPLLLNGLGRHGRAIMRSMLDDMSGFTRAPSSGRDEPR